MEPEGLPNLPELPEPTLSNTPVLGSSDGTALMLQGLIRADVSEARDIAFLGHALLSPLASARQSEMQDGCWSTTYPDGECTATWEICPSEDGYEWTEKLDGKCFLDGYSCDHWVAVRVTTDSDGTEGNIRMYAWNSAAVSGTWTWDVSTDGTRGVWTKLRGDADSEEVIQNLTWTTHSDGFEDIIRTYVAESKWRSHISGSGSSGWLKSYNWHVRKEEWSLWQRIAWDSGHGSRELYDEERGVVGWDEW